ncbi:MAG: MFS transporter [Hamadaea sp.]|uniref:MFS transporter n=1 Tax=Hamadaea sp. TaxID=2024425 RepID=UPI0018002BA8|nr:MFS transporter [Hamadaea sp.]NUT20578.1 MFS transporter [Hamadaea sp.]
MRAGSRPLVPLALAQFICSFAGSNMNVMINDISHDLHTTVAGVQLSITLFLLVMAALMIPGGKLTDKFGRKRCFQLGLMVYGVGALLCAVAPGLGVLVLGNSILEGVGTALLIPPVYILATLYFTDLTSRARAFGMISAMAGVGAATGPLLGGLITSAFSWRAAFVFQAMVIVVIIVLGRGLTDPLPAQPDRTFDIRGTVLSAAGLILIVSGILLASKKAWLMLVMIAAGAAVLALFFRHVRTTEAAGREPLLSMRLFGSRVANLGMITQNLQWLVLMGTSFVVAAFLQVVRGYNAIETGLIFTAATVGVLGSSLAAERLAKRWPQRTLIETGFFVTVVGICALLLIVTWSAGGAPALIPGLFVIGVGIGLMITPSVNIVQSAFGEKLQGEISGLSRSVSNLGSSLGTAVAGTVIVAGIARTPERSYALAMLVLAIAALAGLLVAERLPKEQPSGGAAPDGTASDGTADATQTEVLEIDEQQHGQRLEG